MTLTLLTIGSADYESYATVAEADAYLAADSRLNTIWSAVSVDDRKRDLITAARQVNRQTWQGTANPLAIGILTLTATPLSGETVVIGTRTYTFQSSLTDVDGNVLIGADADGSLANLIAAITLGAGSGTAYAASTTLNADVTAQDIDGTRMLVTSKLGGSGPTALATTTTVSGGSWGAATLAASTLAWPRSNVTNAAGGTLDANTIPLDIVNGVITLAALIAENPTLGESATTGSNIERVRAGTVEVEFFRPTTGTLFPTVVHDLFGTYLESALVGREGSISGASATGTSARSKTPKANSFGTEYGLSEGYG